ncbi:hypothetical protein BDZ89DRAFT_1073070, partial [Hymenopellis radicata]
MAKFLPLELILLILQTCSDMDTLRSCCTVCRSWLPLSQPLLFERTNLVSFIRQADSGSMGRLIKNVHVVFDSENRIDANACHFSLLGKSPVVDAPCSNPTNIHPSPFFAVVTTLTRLVLVNVMIRQFDKDILSLPNLKQLSLEYVTFSEWSQASATEVTMSSPIPQLQALSIRTLQVHFDALVEHLLSHMMALRRLDVNCINNQHLSSDTLEY